MTDFETGHIPPAVADSADRSSVERVSAEAVEAERRLATRRHRHLGAAVGLTAAAAVAFVTWGQSDPDGPQQSASGPQSANSYIPLPVKDGEPCYQAVQYTPQELAKVADAGVDA
jgi:hypothetical protein